MSAPIRIKEKGTGSEQAKHPQITEAGAVLGYIIQKPCYAPEKLSSAPIPTEITDQGLAVFRWGLAISSGYYPIEQLEIMLPKTSRWLNFVNWCYETFGQVPTYLVSQVGIDSGNWGSAPEPLNDFLYCAPMLAANCVLHTHTSSPVIKMIGGAMLLHVFRKWVHIAYREPFTVSAVFDEDSLEFKFSGSNRLVFFLERPSRVGTQWSGFYPDAAGSTILDAQPVEDAPGVMWANGHPWPEYNEDNFVSGIVPVYAYASGYPNLGQPVIPLSFDGEAAQMTYLSSPATWQQYDDNGRLIFDAKLGGDYYAEPYARWSNINPAEANELASTRTSITALPMPTGVSFVFDLMGRYRDTLGRVQILAMGINYPVGALTEDETTETVEGMTCALVKDMPLQMSAIDEQTLNDSASWYNCVAWSPQGAHGEIKPRITSDYYTRRLKLYRSFEESVYIPENSGPELVVNISTGLGVPTWERETAEVCFFIVGSFTLEPLDDAPEPTSIEITSMYEARITIPIRDVLEVVDSQYAPFQKVKLRYRITYLSGKLYPTTVGIGQASGSRPDYGAKYEGYELQ